ncbi:MAG TPA: DUF2142 domain-containing protein [Rugosimonospora sp.]|nr:DUF2142 domain-containing protein [Rugosimonospora sp.]
MAARHGTRLVFWLAWAAFTLIASGWAIGLPVNGSYDEKEHIVRAYAVATGQLTSSRTVPDRRGDPALGFTAPASLLPTGRTVDCTWSPRPPKTADCQRFDASAGTVVLPSAAARYSPVYYLPVGLPLVLLPDRTGVLLAREVSALLCALLLAAAAALAVRVGSRLLILGLALAATPITVNRAGAVNPNGLEICAGILTGTALLGLARAPDGRLDPATVRRLLAGAAVGSFLLLTVRQLGPVLLGMIVVGCALAAAPGRVRSLARRRAVVTVLGGVWLVGSAAAVGWLFASRITDIRTGTRDARALSATATLGHIATDRVPFYVDQFVGLFGYGEVDTPRFARPLWYLLVLVVVAAGAALGGRRVLLPQVWLLATGLLFLGGLDFWFISRVGWFAQGRYALPALAGVVLVPAAALDGLLDRVRALRWAVPAAGGLLAVLHGYVLARVITRFARGVDAPLDPFGGRWHPPLGAWPPLLAVVAGGALLVALLATVVRRSTAVPAEHPPAGIGRPAPDAVVTG